MSEKKILCKLEGHWKHHKILNYILLPLCLDILFYSFPDLLQILKLAVVFYTDIYPVWCFIDQNLFN